MDEPLLMQGNRPWYQPSPGQLTGRRLRYLLTTMLTEAGRPLRVRDLVALCENEGVVFGGRPSKIISDSLRWEIKWGRVTRTSWGQYRATPSLTPRSTKRWIAHRVEQIRTYLTQLRNQPQSAHYPAPIRPSTFDPWTVILA